MSAACDADARRALGRAGPRLCSLPRVAKGRCPGDVWDKRGRPVKGPLSHPLQHRDTEETLWRLKNTLKSDEEWSKWGKDFTPWWWVKRRCSSWWEGKGVSPVRHLTIRTLHQQYIKKQHYPKCLKIMKETKKVLLRGFFTRCILQNQLYTEAMQIAGASIEHEEPWWERPGVIMRGLFSLPCAAGCPWQASHKPCAPCECWQMFSCKWGIAQARCLLV